MLPSFLAGPLMGKAKGFIAQNATGLMIGGGLIIGLWLGVPAAIKAFSASQVSIGKEVGAAECVDAVNKAEIDDLRRKLSEAEAAKARMQGLLMAQQAETTAAITAAAEAEQRAQAAITKLRNTDNEIHSMPNMTARICKTPDFGCLLFDEVARNKGRSQKRLPIKMGDSNKSAAALKLVLLQA